MTKLSKYKYTEYFHFDGEEFITFDVIAVGEENRVLCVAVTNRGKVTINDYEVCYDKSNQPFFYFGSPEEKIYLKNFEEAA